MLSPEQQDYVASHLGNFVGNGVDIDVDGATPMTSDFADALRASLKKAGIGAKRNDAMFIGPCLKYPGVSFMVGVNRFSEAEAIWGALLGARAVEGKGQACNRSGEPDELHIYVRPPG